MIFCKDCRHWFTPSPWAVGLGDPRLRCVASISVTDPITGIVSKRLIGDHTVLNKNNTCPEYEVRPPEPKAIVQVFRLLTGR